MHTGACQKIRIDTIYNGDKHYLSLKPENIATCIFGFKIECVRYFDKKSLLIVAIRVIHYGCIVVS